MEALVRGTITVDTSCFNAYLCISCSVGYLDYVYGTWWRCRHCGAWAEVLPDET
jgi:hypothetical protein